jgi:hypothetical protein
MVVFTQQSIERGKGGLLGGRGYGFSDAVRMREAPMRTCSVTMR